MAKFKCKMAITYHKEITIYASDEAEAEEKACDLVAGWKDVQDVEALEITED